MPEQDAMPEGRQEVFLSEDAPELEDGLDSTEQDNTPRENLAEDEDLCRKVTQHLQSQFEKFKQQRREWDDILQVADWMWKCGQNETVRESERVRQDRQGDSLTKTKAKKLGSTMFYRQTRTLTAVLADILFSDANPYKFTARRNPELYATDRQAEELANEHNLLMRWTRDRENFPVKALELLTQVVKYGNCPICWHWKRKEAEVLDRWPIAGAGGIVSGTKIERRNVLIENRPDWEIVLNENFYADPTIGDIQKQNTIVVTSTSNITDYIGNDEYVNTDKIGPEHVYQGRVNDSLRGDKDLNAGQSAETSDVQTGLFLQYDATALLPIDEDQPKGKRWDAQKHAPKKFWVTVLGNDIHGGLCLRIERNPEPDDEFPFEMVSLSPDDTDRLYKFGLAQALRGTFTELVTAKAQAIDAKTLNNNRPLKAIRGEVMTANNDFSFGKDKLFWVEKENSLTEFSMTPIAENERAIAYLENDADVTAGTIQAVQGTPMGGRTSASEAGRAYGQAAMPINMMAKYVFNKWLLKIAQKGVRMWHLHATDKQIVKITDEKGAYHYIRPADLFGDFDVVTTIVDDYQRDFMTQQNMITAAQNFLPLFIDVVDKRGLAKEVFQRFLKLDVSKYVLPDKSTEAAMMAKAENAELMQGKYVAPMQTEDFATMLRFHEGLRLQYNGIENEGDNANVVALLDRHIAETKFLRDQTMAARPVGNMPAVPGNRSQGEVEGNAIAGQMGAIANAG